tara:strand:- start:1106 stop:1225 length:120 start_codon:yes stop_codon:yes gene_type:complete
MILIVLGYIICIAFICTIIVTYSNGKKAAKNNNKLNDRL